MLIQSLLLVVLALLSGCASQVSVPRKVADSAPWVGVGARATVTRQRQFDMVKGEVTVRHYVHNGRRRSAEDFAVEIERYFRVLAKANAEYRPPWSVARIVLVAMDPDVYLIEPQSLRTGATPRIGTVGVDAGVLEWFSPSVGQPPKEPERLASGEYYIDVPWGRLVVHSQRGVVEAVAR